MNAIIEIKTEIIGTEETNAVNARELHEALELKRQFGNWIHEQIDSLGLEENVDYIVFNGNVKNLIGGRPSKEYILTLDAAKHIAMASRSAKGKEVRAYFIEVEKRYRSGAVVSAEQTHEMSAALRVLGEGMARLGEGMAIMAQTLAGIDAKVDRIEQRMVNLEHAVGSGMAHGYKRLGKRQANRLVAQAYESRRAAFVESARSVMACTSDRLHQSELLRRCGYRRDDKTARKWLGEGDGIYWHIRRDGNRLIYSPIDAKAA
ncbi:MAG: antA/AntB antirepressor family protein [Sulfurovum sp.]|nr:antA/AntB antirepressor family protein [Sulfurovum sp.]